MKSIYGMEVIISKIEPNPEWWLEQHSWLDEDFRVQFNASLFEAFGHLVKPSYYMAEQNAIALYPLCSVALSNGSVIMTNEVGVLALQRATEKSNLGLFNSACHIYEDARLSAQEMQDEIRKSDGTEPRHGS